MFLFKVAFQSRRFDEMYHFKMNLIFLIEDLRKSYISEVFLFIPRNLKRTIGNEQIFAFSKNRINPLLFIQARSITLEQYFPPTSFSYLQRLETKLSFFVIIK